MVPGKGGRREPTDPNGAVAEVGRNIAAPFFFPGPIDLVHAEPDQDVLVRIGGGITRFFGSGRVRGNARVAQRDRRRGGLIDFQERLGRETFDEDVAQRLVAARPTTGSPVGFRALYKTFGDEWG